MNIHMLLPLLSSVLFLVAGLIIFVINKDVSRNAFLRFCYVTFHWQFSWLILFSIGNEYNATLLSRIGYSGIIFIPVTFFDSLCFYLHKKSGAVIVMYIISAFYLIILWTSDLFIAGYYKTMFGYYPKAGCLHISYMGIVIYVFVHSVLLIKKELKSEENSHIRTQIILYYSGVLVYAGASVDYMLNYPDLLKRFNVQLYPFGVFFIIVSIFLFMLAHKSRLNNILEQQVEERTEELKRSLEMLKEVQDAKKKFIASIAHDLKNPLSVISGYAEILGIKLTPETKEHKAAGYINTCANQIGRLIDSLVQISLLESNELKPKLEAYNYTQFINEYLYRFEEQATTRNITLEWMNCDENIIVKSDMLWLERILGNLVQNAFKYVENNGKINVKVYRDSNYVITEVNDTGIGIPEDKVANVFIRKYQAHDELQKEGYGLGLSIVKEMLELLGGTITVESKVGAGTRFTYTLPLYADQNARGKNETGLQVFERRSGVDRRKDNRINELIAQIDDGTRMGRAKKELKQYEKRRDTHITILICDDNPSQLQIIAEKLTGEYNMVFADNGEMGYKTLMKNSRRFSAVITDVEMPVMNGIALCKKVKETDEVRNIPVIVMTSYYNETDKEHAKECGAAHYTGKNKQKEEWMELLQTVLCTSGG